MPGPKETPSPTPVVCKKKKKKHKSPRLYRALADESLRVEASERSLSMDRLPSASGDLDLDLVRSSARSCGLLAPGAVVAAGRVCLHEA